MIKNNVPFVSLPPTCSTPERIQGKSWNQLQLDDFACVPKVTSLQEHERISRVIEGENGTLLCRVRATPDTQVNKIQILGGPIEFSTNQIHNPKEKQFSPFRKFRNWIESVSDITGWRQE